MDKETYKKLIRRALGTDPNSVERAKASGSSFIKAGKHKLQLVKYDFFDGEYDVKSGRGYKSRGKIQSAFFFTVIESDTMSPGESCARFFRLDESNTTRIKFIYGELYDLIAALATAKGQEVPDMDTIIDELLPDVSEMEELLAATVHCEGKPSGKVNEDGQPFVNLTWHPVEA